MKIIAIGDLHGRTLWKYIVSKVDFDVVVFIGDYFDTHENISPVQQIENFKELLDYKKQLPEKVVLLFGNHDYHYFPWVEKKYSGFQDEYDTEILEILHNALKEGLMQMCYKYKKFVFTHAGITKTWLSKAGYKNNYPVDIFLNDLFVKYPHKFEFSMGDNYSLTGDDICQSPIWVRPKSLSKNALNGYIQIVGHTVQEKINVINNSIILIDTLGKSAQFLEVREEGWKILQLSMDNASREIHIGEVNHSII